MARVRGRRHKYKLLTSTTESSSMRQFHGTLTAKFPISPLVTSKSHPCVSKTLLIACNVMIISITLVLSSLPFSIFLIHLEIIAFTSFESKHSRRCVKSCKFIFILTRASAMMSINTLLIHKYSFIYLLPTFLFSFLFSFFFCLLVMI